MRQLNLRPLPIRRASPGEMRREVISFVPGPGAIALAAAASLLVLALAARPVHAQVLVGVAPSEISAGSGETVTIPIVVDMSGGGGASLGAYRVRLTWDQAVLEYHGTASGTYAGAPAVNEANSGIGEIALAGASAAGAGGAVVIAQVTFNVLSGTGSTPLNIGLDELTAAGTFADLLGNAAPVSGLFCANSGPWGDVVRDGVLLANDALAVLTASVGLPIAPYDLTNADVDADGKDNARDALIILSAAVALPTSGFRVGTTNTGACSVTPAVALGLVPGVVDLASGDRLALRLSATDAGGNVVSAPGAAWFSDNTGAATVDTAGRVTAVGNGTASISAMALGGLNASIVVNVAPRHQWYVAAAANDSATQLGSNVYPFSRIQQAVTAANAGDTIHVALGDYTGPVILSQRVTVLGDSTAGGMPVIRNSGGPAIRSNAAGLVTVRRFLLTESNTGFFATGDSVDASSIRAATIRGPGFHVHKMLHAKIRGFSANSVELGGIFADSNRVLDAANLDIRIVGKRGDSAAAVIAVGGDTAIYGTIFAMGIQDGPAAFFGQMKRVVFTDFTSQYTNGVQAEQVQFIHLARGTVNQANNDQAIALKADTAIVDTVLVHGAQRGMSFQPAAPDSLRHPLTMVTIEGSTVDTVQNGAAMQFERLGSVRVLHSRVSTSFGGNGVDVRRVDTVALVGVQVDSTGIDFSRSFDPAFGVSVHAADSVRIDSLRVVGGSGGGVWLDSARVVVGRGSVIANNRGYYAPPVDCGQSCGAPPNISRAAAFTLITGRGLLATTVETLRLSHFALDSNVQGGMWVGHSTVTASTTVDSSTFTNNGHVALLVTSNPASGGSVALRGGSFALDTVGVSVSNLRRFDLQGVRFDSVGVTGEPAVNVSSVDSVFLTADTLRYGSGPGIYVQSAAVAEARGNVFRHRQYFNNFLQEAALETADADSVVVYGNRVEFGTLRGIIVRGSGAKTAAVDSNVVADDSSYAIQIHRPATVTRNLMTRNSNGLYIGDNGYSSTITGNSFVGNLFRGMQNDASSAVTAQSNWWNDPNGPQCTGFATGCGPGLGDVAQGAVAAIDVSSFLTSPPVDAPVAAPRRTATREGTR